MPDILARMRAKMTDNGLVSMRKLGILELRARNFRMTSGLVGFRLETIKARVSYLDSLRTPAQRENNQAIDRDLTAEEIAIYQKLGKRGSRNAVASQSSSSAVESTPIAASVFICTKPSISSAHHIPSATESAPAKPLTPAAEPAPKPAAEPIPEPAAEPVPEPTPSDSREDVPKTSEESSILIDSLEETVRHFVKLTGDVPQFTNFYTSYSDQWDALQAQLASIWKSQRPAEKTPVLYKLAKWTGGIACCKYGRRTQVSGEQRDREDDLLAKHVDDTREE